MTDRYGLDDDQDGAASTTCSSSRSTGPSSATRSTRRCTSSCTALRAHRRTTTSPTRWCSPARASTSAWAPTSTTWKTTSSYPDGHPGLLIESVGMARNILAVRVPMISAINGDAIGIGATISLFCDIVYMADHARIADPHVKGGMVAGDGGAVLWPLLMGPNRAKEYLMTGDLVDRARGRPARAGEPRGPGRVGASTRRWRWRSGSPPVPRWRSASTSGW